VTSDLEKWVARHKARLYERFTRRYRVTRLAYSERHDDIVSAIRREKAIKHWPRAWKVDLIMEQNPNWEDLAGGNWRLDTAASWRT